MNYSSNTNWQQNRPQQNMQGFGQGYGQGNVYGSNFMQNFMQKYPQFAQRFPNFGQNNRVQPQNWVQPQGMQAYGQGSPPANMPNYGQQYQMPQYQMPQQFQGIPQRQDFQPRQGFRDRGDMNFAGGNPDFDESTGQPRQNNGIYG